MRPGQPLWRRTFDRAERAVGAPLEDLVGTREFTSLLVAIFRLERALYGLFERQSRGLLHLLNLPARTDISRLNRQVVTLASEVRLLAARLEEERDAASMATEVDSDRQTAP